MKKYLEYFISASVLMKEEENPVPYTGQEVMLTRLTQPEILLGKGMPHEIGKFSFGLMRVKYQSLSSVAFRCLMVPSSSLLSSPFPPLAPPRYSN